MLNFRQYSDDDFDTLSRWYKTQGMEGLTMDFIPDTTYIAEWNNEPIASLSLIVTNLREYAYLENLVGNPAFDKKDRRFAVQGLVKFVEGTAKQLGYHKLLCLAPNGKLELRYAEMGYTPSLYGVTAMVKEL